MAYIEDPKRHSSKEASMEPMGSYCVKSPVSHAAEHCRPFPGEGWMFMELAGVPRGWQRKHDARARKLSNWAPTNML